MLLAADPQVPLQVRRTRSAWCGAFVSNDVLPTPEQQAHIVDYAKHLRPSLYSGEIDIRGFFETEVVEACSDLTNRVERLLSEYGWLEREDNQQFLWNTRLMRTRGAPYHTDAHNPSWHDRLFWVYVLQAEGVDLRFPNLGLAVPMQSGQLIVFDPLQPHGVVKTGSERYAARHHGPASMQVYLSGDMCCSSKLWEALGLEERTATLGRAPYQDIEKLGAKEDTGELVSLYPRR